MEFTEMTTNELMDCDGGIIGFIIVLGVVFVVGVAVGYGVGYCLG